MISRSSLRLKTDKYVVSSVAALDPAEEDERREHERKRARDAKEREDQVQTFVPSHQILNRLLSVCVS